MKIYVEGGGDAASLKAECRKGFAEFLEKAGFKRPSKPSIVACGSRDDTFDSFATAIRYGEEALILVDSEVHVQPCHQQGKPNQWKPWNHLKQRDNWDKPANADDTQCHLMVQCMEAWFIADRQMLASFFGQHFTENQLPDAANAIESISKEKLYDALAKATRSCQKGQYGKGEHSFKLLALINPANVISASPWVKRFFDTLKERLK